MITKISCVFRVKSIAHRCASWRGAAIARVSATGPGRRRRSAQFPDTASRETDGGAIGRPADSERRTAINSQLPTANSQETPNPQRPTSLVRQRASQGVGSRTRACPGSWELGAGRVRELGAGELGVGSWELVVGSWEFGPRAPGAAPDPDDNPGCPALAGRAAPRHRPRRAAASPSGGRNGLPGGPKSPEITGSGSS